MAGPVSPRARTAGRPADPWHHLTHGAVAARRRVVADPAPRDRAQLSLVPAWWLWRLTHGTHHTGNDRMCTVSLFVMHPAEPAGFAGVVLVLLLLWPVSFLAIATFFGINLVIGTLAHLPVDAARRVRWTDRNVGGAVLHQGHHRDEAANFGFFTAFWDTALRTRAHPS